MSVRKCCGTCDWSNRRDGCGIEYCCTRHYSHNVPEDEQDVRYDEVKRGELADRWMEGESIENLWYRIRELEKKVGGV